MRISFNLTQSNKFSVFIWLVFIQVMLLFLCEYVLFEDSLLFDYFQNQYAYEKIQKLINEAKRWKWLSYALVPIFTLIKCVFLAVCLYVGAFFARKENGFVDFFQIAIRAEFIFLIPILIKIVWFGIFHRNYGLEELSYFFPFSILSLLDRNELSPWNIYPLQILNAFELLYWLFVAYQLKSILNKSLLQNLGFVATSYGVGLLIWVILVMFLTVSIS